MSGVLKSVGKVFKKVVKSKIFKIVAIAAAIYFTGGLAAGALGSTFAATLPGIAEAAGALGITAGAFSEGAMALAGVMEAGTVLGASAVMDAEAAITGSAALMGEGSGIAGLAGAGEIGESVSGAWGAGSGGIVDGGVGAINAAESAANASADLMTPSNVASTSSSATITGTPQGYTPPATPPATPPTMGSIIGPENSIAQGASGAGKSLPSGWDQTMAWLNKPENAFTAKMLLQGLSTGGYAAVKAIGEKSALDEYSSQRDQDKADIIRRGAVPNLADIWRGQVKKPGIVNNGTGY